jgi:hypothetical protein
MRFTAALSTLLPTALMGTALGSEPVDTSKGTVYSPKDYSFKDYGNGTLAILPLNGKRQFEFCDYWNSWVVCETGLSDTNVCTDTYCSCEGADIECTAGTTCTDTCSCYVYCSDL